MSVSITITIEEARDRSLSLFRAIDTLTVAKAQLETNFNDRRDDDDKNDASRIASTLLHGVRVAHASCETALTRVEPFYTNGAQAACDVFECRAMADTALTGAHTVVVAIQYACFQCADWAASPFPLSQAALCSDNAIRDAIDMERVGEVALGVVLAANDTTRHDNLVLYVCEKSNAPNTPILRMLLASPVFVASLDDCNERGDTPLMVAISHRHVEAVTTLLACPAVIQSATAENGEGWNALMSAIQFNDTVAVTALLACPLVAATADCVDANGETALMLAVTMENHAFVTELLACPVVAASAGAASFEGKTALMIGAGSNNAAIVATLLSCPAVAASAGAVNERHGRTALMMACARWEGVSADIVTALLACPTVAAAADLKHSGGQTALMLAAECGNENVIGALLACPVIEASASAASCEGKTALMYACYHGRANAVVALLASSAAEASADAVDSWGDTALMIAASNEARIRALTGTDNAATIVALLTSPRVAASANTAGRKNETALTIALECGNVGVVSALLECPVVAAAAINRINGRGETVLMLAAQYFPSNSGPTITALLACPEVAASARAVDRNGQTALMIASWVCNIGAVAALLVCPEVAASAGAIDKNGQTALIIASQRNNTAIIIALLVCPEVVMTVDTVDKWGKTALVYATRHGNAAAINAIQGALVRWHVI